MATEKKKKKVFNAWWRGTSYHGSSSACCPSPFHSSSCWPGRAHVSVLRAPVKCVKLFFDRGRELRREKVLLPVVGHLGTCSLLCSCQKAVLELLGRSKAHLVPDISREEGKSFSSPFLQEVVVTFSILPAPAAGPVSFISPSHLISAQPFSLLLPFFPS